jgi:hypothetical protein
MDSILTRELPLALLADSARSEILPKPLRRDVALAAWTKAILLGQDETARALVPIVEALAPELKAGLDGYIAATTKEERRFAAVFFILHTPGIRPYVEAGLGRSTPLEEINSYRDNWWWPYTEWNGPEIPRSLKPSTRPTRRFPRLF